jgi:polyisoprenoid-binding protein YceI
MTWILDPAHSAVTFSARHMMVTTVRGTMAIRDIDLAFDPDAPERSRIRVSLDAASIDTGQEARDAHLRSDDFLATEAHPTIEFVSTGVEPHGEAWRIQGDLTIRGVTRPVTLYAQLGGVVANLQGGRRAAFGATTTIDRDDFGLAWNVALESGGWLVSREVRIEIDLAVVTAAADERLSA